jgi:hypothetical protein
MYLACMDRAFMVFVISRGMKTLFLIVFSTCSLYFLTIMSVYNYDLTPFMTARSSRDQRTENPLLCPLVFLKNNVLDSSETKYTPIYTMTVKKMKNETCSLRYPVQKK